MIKKKYLNNGVNCDILVFNDNSPFILKMGNIPSYFNCVKKTSNEKLEKYDIQDNILIPTYNESDSLLKLKRIKSFSKLKNYSYGFGISSRQYGDFFAFKPFYLTSKNKLYQYKDSEFSPEFFSEIKNQDNLFVKNQSIRNIDFKRIDKVQDVDLNFELGYFYGVFLNTGYFHEDKFHFNIIDNFIETTVNKMLTGLNKIDINPVIETSTNKIHFKSVELEEIISTITGSNEKKFIANNFLIFNLDFIEGLFRGLLSGETGVLKFDNEYEISFSLKERILINRLSILFKYNFGILYRIIKLEVPNKPDEYVLKFENSPTMLNILTKEGFDVPDFELNVMDFELIQSNMINIFKKEETEFYFIEVEGSNNFLVFDGFIVSYD